MTRKFRKSKIKKLFILVITILLASACSSEKHPSNSELIEFFKQNKSDIERLRLMFLEDKNLYVIGRYNDGTKYVKLYDRNEYGITVQRESEYFKILERLNLINIGTEHKFRNGEKTAIFISISGRGGGPLGGTVKRYLWFNRKTTKLDVQKKGAGILDFIPIEDNWYLLFEYYG